MEIRRAAYHQAGHALLLILRELPVTEISIPEELPESSADLEAPQPWGAADETLDQRRFEYAVAGLEAERQVLDRGGALDGIQLSQEFTTHMLNGLDRRWNVNVSGARRTMQHLIKEQRSLLNAIAGHLVEHGSASWGDLLMLAAMHRRVSQQRVSGASASQLIAALDAMDIISAAGRIRKLDVQQQLELAGHPVERLDDILRLLAEGDQMAAPDDKEGQPTIRLEGDWIVALQ